jgi:glycine cleavage system H protein
MMNRTPFRGAVPDGLLYDPDHDMWVRREGEEVVIGASAFGIFLAGEIIAFTAKPKGAEVERGRGLGTVECAKTVLAVHAPLSFVLIAANEAAEERPPCSTATPTSPAGWCAAGPRPGTERARLVDAVSYRAHIRRIEPDAEFL